MAQDTTTSVFSAMLKQYAPNEIFRNEILKRDWFLTNIERDESWLGGDLLVPFKGAGASSIRAGKLVPEAKINQSVYVKGSITKQPEIWGALVFNERDLSRHGKINEQNFLKILPGEIEDFVAFMKMSISQAFTTGAIFAKGLAGGDLANGVVKVDRVERFEVDQRLYVKDSDTAAFEVYVKSIDMNTDKVTLSASSGGAAMDLAAAGLEEAKSIQFFIPGMENADNRLSNLKTSLLSAANGGDAELYGQSKLAYPYLQAINIDGSAITSANILDKLFEAQNTVRQKGKGMPNIAVMSYRLFGYVLASLQAVQGTYRFADEMSASLYGWTEVTIAGVKGTIKIVAIQEMDNDCIFILDKSAMKVYSNGFIEKRKDPDTGREFFTVRSEDGFKYIVDIRFFGDMVLEKPARCGIIYGITA